MVRNLVLVAAGSLAIVALAACKKPLGACVWTLATPVRGIAQTCRDDATRATCVAYDPAEPVPTFTPGRTCPQVGFGCLGDGFDAAYRRTNPDGTCPPGSSM